ncbi:hypothetical protein PPL_06211 [Heterostelium album PN500]|uniref:Uncharacterized protein n=1 Tax=Heterostelium pallidum (strain ATCC 26659 / Pp 5 / PN500) TaxID=670386 RepID=D3BCI6_HETP5|nr:hypothetical protein PPL_06211 [Heterostelium album PN500]EFA80628.1 hypothetical protein PPL_06211 [Heterostelium album PN500]|eukprot:XP_020432748.1 hypothetical protein PPL_06211 [Heterostelium album PN500]
MIIKIKNIILSLVLIYGILEIVESHSFMNCVDYDFGANRCRAYPRNFRVVEFSGDKYLYQLGKFTKPLPTSLGKACGPSQNRYAPVYTQYSEKFPMGIFSQGQKICSQWPARNHATQPRAGSVGFYLSNKKGDYEAEDDTQEEFFNHPIISRPFGNCTKYYENTNNATCTACYNIPNVENGLYTLQWFWEFNPQEYYMTCADIVIAGNGNPIPVKEEEYIPAVQPQQYIPADVPIISKRDTPLFGVVKPAEHLFYHTLLEVLLMEDGQFNHDMVKDVWTPNRVWSSPMKFREMNTIEMVPEPDGGLTFLCSNDQPCFTGKYFDGFHFFVKGSLRGIQNLKVAMASAESAVVKDLVSEADGSKHYTNDFTHFSLAIPEDVSYTAVRIFGNTKLADDDHVFIGKISVSNRVSSIYINENQEE